jgi:hypothetical protein
MNIEKSILGLSKALFWDVDPKKIDPQKHAAYIIERVLTRGTWEEFKNILNYYDKDTINLIITNLRYLEKTTLSFCSAYFNIPLKKFRCYTFQQSNRSHWDY